MREYVNKSENQFRTLDSNSKASRQVPVDVILQQYKKWNIQRYAKDQEQVQGKFDIAQHKEIDIDELLQGKFESDFITEQKTIQREERPNNTGLPDDLKTNIENLPSLGQEKHLPHETWYVVQQKQGRVQTTLQMQEVSVNDNEGEKKDPNTMVMISIAKTIEKTIPKKQIEIQKKKKRILTSDSVAQLITYKSVKYSRTKDDYNAFNAQANNDLDALNSERNKERDQKMLKVIGNSDFIVSTSQELSAIINPIDKGYQKAIDNEFSILKPVISEVSDSADRVPPRLEKDDSPNSYNDVIKDMDVVKEKTDFIKKYIQWRKVDKISSLANEVQKAVAHSKSCNELMLKKTTEISKIARDIEPEIRQSGDEQYLRGTVGAKADGFGGSHLTIGKKSATKLLLEKNKEEAEGILWASVWSEGVNKAFIEGGTDKKHEFRLISPLPVELEPALKTGNISAFIETLKRETNKTHGADPWRAYYHLGKNDLTTLGREIVQILEAGYILE